MAKDKGNVPMEKEVVKVPSSFRDPSGYLFYQDGVLYRKVNKSYWKHYEYMLECGLYDNLVESGLLIPHNGIYPDVLRPEQVEFISYPYEWCFSQLKDAALTTLLIQKRAMEYGMILKDASAYNIQFHKGKPTLIDTLSFEIYEEGKPWIAYRQFCRHFLAPLMLMAHKDIRLSQLLKVYIDGIPIDLAYSLLPFRARHNPHIFFQAKGQGYVAKENINVDDYKVSKNSLVKLIKSLELTISNLKWKSVSKEKWDSYYEGESYTKKAFFHKKWIISIWLDTLNPKTVWDLGANTGVFSCLAKDRNIMAVSFDSDPAVIEQSYLNGRGAYLLPLVLDLTNPSSSIGWANKERQSLIERGPADMVLALALVHHLTISNNVPLEMIAEFFSKLCQELVIEFVPKENPQVQRLLSTRKDIFDHYTIEDFELEFGKFFFIKEKKSIIESDRILYLMEKR